MDGRYDHLDSIQAFARHRIAVMEDAAQVADGYRENAGGSASYCYACRHIADSIRALKEDG